MVYMRFTCYKFNNKIVHDVLSVGSRSQIDTCVGTKIKLLSPRHDGIVRAGVCP